MRWGKKKRTLVQDGLFQIGAQSYQILLRGPPLQPPEEETPVVVLIPTPNQRPDQHFRDYDEWDSRYMLRTDQDDFGTGYNDMWNQKGWFKPSCIPITIILLLIVLVVLLPLLDAAEKQHRTVNFNMTLNQCQQKCNFSLVETIPIGLVYNNGSPKFQQTFNLWRNMIEKANNTIEIATFYWTLKDGEASKLPGWEEGVEIFDQLLQAGKRGVKIKIVQNEPSKHFPDTDSEILARKKIAEVRSLNMPKLVGNGILRTKLWIIDRSSAYIGSANNDWRSLTHDKELGIHLQNCSCLLKDISKLFDVYWLMALPDAQIPLKWPDNLSTNFNEKTPIQITLNDAIASIYISSSPPQLCPSGRQSDIDSIISTIQKADKFIYIAVMDYMPVMIYTAKPIYWPIIDDALRGAAINRKTEIRLLISLWNHTEPQQKIFLKSMTDINGVYKGVKISVKLFVVPSNAEQLKIPAARVNHNKYMVTDNIAYIGTSNWSGDYFVNTGGVGVIIEGDNYIRSDLENVFLRDWNSQYAHDLNSTKINGFWNE